MIWGPAECTVYSTAFKHTSLTDSPTNIGTPLGCRIWITDPDDPNLLAPIGAVGEFLVEGPIVAAGYFNDAEKTSQCFIAPPAWARLQDETENHSTRRFYRTADMGRYDHDGTLHFVGRRDNQVKVRGQRVELSEIDHQARAHQSVEHCLTFYPQKGPFKGQVTAVLTFVEGILPHSLQRPLEVLPLEAVNEHIGSVREHLSARVASYTNPASFIAVESMPLMPSGKLSRSKTAEWLATISEELARRLQRQSEEIVRKGPQSSMEEALQAAWSYCLGVPQDEIGTNTPFLSLGGDSITAMQVVARCRAGEIKVSVQDVLETRTISALALRAKTIKSTAPINVAEDNELESRPMGLSPAQRLYFQATGELGLCRFHQSFLLALQSRISAKQLQIALCAVVETHSMLRARFWRDQGQQTWLQRIGKDAGGSFRLTVYPEVSNDEGLAEIVEKTHSYIDIEKGPLFSVALCELVPNNSNKNSQSQVLFLACHHAVIDLVSWRIVLGDLESLLMETSLEIMPQSASFASWNSSVLESQNSSRHTVEVPKVYLSYWGLPNDTSTYASSDVFSLTLDDTITDKLLTVCNKALRTEPVELMVAVLMYAFRSVFDDRPAPAFYIESHGRHPVDNDTDLSRSVGWFTSMYSIENLNLDQLGLSEVVRMIKDENRKLSTRSKLSVGPLPMEILFNYTGKYQQLSKKDALFRHRELAGADLDLMDVDHRLQRFALIDISATHSGNELQFDFRVDMRMKYLDRVQEWIRVSRELLINLPDSLPVAPQPTLSDYTLLRTYTELDHIVSQGFMQAGIHHSDDVQDVYPCTPLQQQMLDVNHHDSRLYIVRSIWDVTNPLNTPIDPALFEVAWKKVVQRHAILRTRFVSIDNTCQYQLVLGDPATRVNIHIVADAGDIHGWLKQTPSLRLDPSECGHIWDVCVTPGGRASVQLQISHALIDGLSIATLLSELSCFYQGIEPETQPASFRSLVQNLNNGSTTEDDAYWANYLDTAKPCYLGTPSMTRGSLALRSHAAICEVEVLRPTEMYPCCTRNSVTPSIIFQLAWAMVIAKLTGSPDACFGYVVAGRDTSTDGGQDAVGPFINFLICRERLAGDRTSAEIMSSLQSSFIKSRSSRHSPLLSKYTAIASTRLFNTVLNYQGSTLNVKENESMINFRHTFAADPMEWDLMVRVVKHRDDRFGVTLEYWEPSITAALAASIGNCLRESLQRLVE